MEWLGYPTPMAYQGLGPSSLPLNHALIFANTSIDVVGVYGLRDDCFHCPYKLEKLLRSGEATSWQVDTGVQWTWRMLRNHQEPQISPTTKGGLLCEMRPTLHEFGVYRLDVGKCAVETEIAPINTYLPLLLSLLMFLGCVTLYKCVRYMIKRRKHDVERKIKHAVEQKLRQEKVLEINVEQDKDESFPALQVFRGIVLALIIFFTTGGGGYPIFNNIWGGLSFAECLFFGYAWSVGVNIPNVIDEAFVRQTKFGIIKKIFMRSFFLIAFGFIIDSTVESITHSRLDSLSTIWSPLQRLGAAYFIVASAYVLTVQRFHIQSKSLIYKAVSSLVCLLWCWIIAAFLLALVVILINILISFNCLAAVTTENHRDLGNLLEKDSENCNNAFTEYVNKLFVAETLKVVDVNGYIGFSRGILGIISTVIYTMIGLKAGVIYLNYKVHAERLKLWGLWAALFGLTGIMFAALAYPLDLNLWPIASIHLLTTTWMYVFMLTYTVVDVSNLSSSALHTFGVTSLPILCGHLLFSNSLPFHWNMHFDNHLLILLQNYWCVALWFLLSWLLKKKCIRFEI